MSLAREAKLWVLHLQVYIPADECVFDEAFPANIQKSATGGGKRNQRKQRRMSIRAAMEVSFI